MPLETGTYIDELNASNPVGTDLQAQGDDHIRLIKATLKSTFPGATKPLHLQKAFVDVASAATVDLGAQTTDNVRITGTTTITSFGTVAAGTTRHGRFAGILTLTHDDTSLILPSGANITTAANDRFIAISLGSGNWLVLHYERASGKAIVPPTVSEIATLSASLALAAAATPVGHVVEYAGLTAPTGWLLCYGQNVSRTTYAALFAALDNGSIWGVGDGSTTFTLPDYRGRVGAGQDDMGGTSANRLTGLSGGVNGDTMGAVGGSESHALVSAENGPHTHRLFVPGESSGATIDANPDSGVASRGDIGSSTDYHVRALAGTPTAGVSGSSGNGTAHNNVQPTIIMNKIIWTGVI